VRAVQVLLRLTEVETKKTQGEQEFLDNVTKYNNTQNSIRISDFRSNDKVQYDIKKRFDNLAALDGKKFLYKNKRSGESARDRIVISMEDFTKTLYAFLFGPDDVFGGTGHVFDATRDGGYVKLFGSHGQLVPTLSNDAFKLYAGIWFLCTFAKDLWREQAEKKDPSHERRWMFYFALGEALRICYGDDQALNDELRSLSTPAWMKRAPSDLPKAAIVRCSRLAFKALTESYKEAAGKPTFTHRNWFRAPATLASVRVQIASSWDLLSEHSAEYRLCRV
jgi:AIPR protein